MQVALFSPASGEVSPLDATAGSSSISPSSRSRSGVSVGVGAREEVRESPESALWANLRFLDDRAALRRASRSMIGAVGHEEREPRGFGTGEGRVRVHRDRAAQASRPFLYSRSTRRESSGACIRLCSSALQLNLCPLARPPILSFFARTVTTTLRRASCVVAVLSRPARSVR